MKKVLLTSLLLATSAYADVGTKSHRLQIDIAPLQASVVVATIDTGLDPKLMSSPSVCKYGHRDFTSSKSTKDNHGHGTHVFGLIDQYAKNVILQRKGRPTQADVQELKDTRLDYCQIIIKYYDPKIPGTDNLKTTIASFKHAIKMKVDIINYSGGGTEFSKEEYAAIKEALDKGIIVVAAAGNERSNIDKHKYYPAMYDSRIIVVGNLVKNIVRAPSAKYDENVAPSSNWGIGVNTWEIGTNMLSYLPDNTFGYMTGTSQATAIKSGKLVRELVSKRHH